MLTYQHLLYGVESGVAEIRLNRPERLNTLGVGPGSSRDEIARALAQADGDPAAGSVLITAAGRAFCAGGDMSGTKAPENAYEEARQVQEIDDFLAAVRGTRKPVVAAVQGLCIGAALGFIAQCDLVIASDDARFGLVEGRIGHPGASGIVPLVGAAWAKYLMLTGDLIDAERAADIGLVLTVVPVADLETRARDLSRRIARLPRESTELNKAAINKVVEAGGQAAGRLAGRTQDVVVRAQSSHARAPDGRTFTEILASEGIAGMKKARDAQFTGSWLPPKKKGE